MASSLGSGFASSTTSTASAACSQLWGGQVRRPDFARCLPAGRSKIVRASLSENVRISLLQALSTQAASRTQQVVEQLAKEAVKYVNPKRGDARSLEEALMTVPDLETIPYRVLRREREYEIRDVESYVLAETSMPGTRGFDFLGSSQGFNTLADYLFGKNKRREKMEMTTPVIVRGSGRGERMEMTTPVISRQAGDRSEWKMSFVIPSKYDESNLPVPEDSRVKTRRVPARIVAVVAFSGFVTDDEVLRRERALRKALERDNGVRVTNFAVPEVAQYNDPFTPPFLRRNEIFLEVELKD